MARSKATVGVIRLEFEIDGEVHPELFAAIAALRGEAARGERLRQLAATGLLWETVRIHGAALCHLPGKQPANSAPDAPTQAHPGARTPRRTSASAANRAVASAQRADFVDLALNAPPGPALPAREREFDRASPHIPVLHDVVGAWPSAPAPAERRPRSVAPRSMPAETTETPTTDHAAAVVMQMHRAAPSSRLLRMKEKGLFKNG